MAATVNGYPMPHSHTQVGPWLPGTLLYDRARTRWVFVTSTGFPEHFTDGQEGEGRVPGCTPLDRHPYSPRIADLSESGPPMPPFNPAPGWLPDGRPTRDVRDHRA